MNTLSHGFFFLAGLAWLLGEVCISASAGFWTPLWLYLLGFTIMFAVMGCLPLSEKTINTAGPIFAIILGAAIIIYGVAALPASPMGGILRIVAAAGLVIMGVVNLMASKNESHAH